MVCLKQLVLRGDGAISKLNIIIKKSYKISVLSLVWGGGERGGIKKRNFYS